MMNLQTNIASFLHKGLSAEQWKHRKKEHEQRISGLIDDYLDQRQKQLKNPVLDFLFEYYTFRPSHLKRWSPGLGVFLKGASPSDSLELSELVFAKGGAFLNPELIPDNRKDSIQWILRLLKNSAQNEPSFGCFGMHEWAMVYQKEPEDVRHSYLSLRMGKDDLADFVESRPLVCTHFDAFRFFSTPAKPMNKFELSREEFAETEQPGCIHTNMDLYKWAFKLYPWISSGTIREAFELALESRYIDMQASPYDLESYGLKPIKIETEEGRKEYLKKQKEIYKKSGPVRNKLINEYRRVREFMGL